MQISCTQPTLLQALNMVLPTTSSKSPMVITRNVLLEARDELLTLTANNGDVSAINELPAKVDRPGAATVSARTLTDYLKTLPKDILVLKTEPESSMLALTCGKHSAKFNTMNPGQFIPVPQLGEPATASMSAADFRKATYRVITAAAVKDNARPILNGVNIKLDGNDFTFAAADGFRLSVQRGKLLTPAEQEINVVVDATTMKQFTQLLSDQEPAVEIALDPKLKLIRFNLSSMEVTTRIIQGDFPAYENLIPDSCKTRSLFELANLQRATNCTALFAAKESNIIRLEVSPREPDEKDDRAALLTMYANAPDDGDNCHFQESIPAIEGPKTKIAFNCQYLQDALTALNEKLVVMETNDPSSPAAFRSNVKTDEYVHILMPMFVQWEEKDEPAEPDEQTEPKETETAV